ncbi:MAG: hypothetical protein JST87_10825 [Bacteroidetes bacterium]|nr:hypothetical protein [Bacteroidota bacterium]
MFTLVLIMSVFASSKGYSGCENPHVACNNKSIKTVTHTDAFASDDDILKLSPIHTMLLL